MASKSKFTSGIKKIKEKRRQANWRRLYRIVHEMSQDTYMSLIPAARNLHGIGILAQGTGLKTRRLAHDLRGVLFETIYENNDSSIILHYDDYDINEHLQFARRTLIMMHNKINSNGATQLNVNPIEAIYPRANQNILGAYRPHDNHIGLSARTLTSNLKTLIKTMSHEYTHVLQETYDSSLSRPLLEFVNRHPTANKTVPYRKKLIEKEARTVAEIVATDFDKQFADYIAQKNSPDR